MKDRDWKYIKTFSKISIRNICLDLGLTQNDYENIIGGKASEKKIHLVRVEIEKRLLKLKELV